MQSVRELIDQFKQEFTPEERAEVYDLLFPGLREANERHVAALKESLRRLEECKMTIVDRPTEIDRKIAADLDKIIHPSA